MSTSSNSILASRRARLTAAAVLPLVMAAAVLTGAAVAPPVGNDAAAEGSNKNSAESGTVSPRSDEGENQWDIFNNQIRWWSSIELGGFRCPARVPYLDKRFVAPNRAVPYGVTVTEPGGVGVTIAGTDNINYRGYIAGWTNKTGSATNWTVYNHHLRVTAHCTGDTAFAAPAH